MLKLEPEPGGSFSVTDPPAQVGRAVYMANCQQCHKADLTGAMPEVPPLIGIVDKLGADQVKTVVQNGQGQMPAFSKLATREVDRLVIFLRNPSAATAPPMRRDPIPAKLTPGSPTRYWTGYNYINASDGFPATKPPFFTLTAYDLNEGKLKWQIPVGEVPALVARGIRNTGSIPTRGGPIVTASGLIVTPSQSDRKIYVYDKETGQTLWSKQLPAAPEGVPTVYEVDGREYLVVCARDVDAPRVRPGQPAPPPDPNKKVVQGYYAFALPK
jgi:quinoprotein glucose dehydrogenase